MEDVIDDEHDNDQLTAGQLQLQHGLTVDNACEKLLKCIQRVYNNAGKLSKARQRVALQHEKEVPPQDQGFIPGNTIRFAPENVRIRLDPKRGWNFHGRSNNPPPPQTLPPP